MPKRGEFTGEGVTPVSSEMLRILEDVLPTGFGGSSLDYRLWKEEDPKGSTRLSLLVSSGIQIQGKGI